MKPAKTIGCSEALTHLLEYLDQELDGTKRREVKHHIELCRSCFSRAEFEQGLKDRLRKLCMPKAGMVRSWNSLRDEDHNDYNQE
jgi:anti-sigma factor (TIGR02949 family)